MAYIVTEPCIDVKDGACAQVCPVDCIPLDPDHAETREQLQAKYQGLIRILGPA